MEKVWTFSFCHFQLFHVLQLLYHMSDRKKQLKISINAWPQIWHEKVETFNFFFNFLMSNLWSSICRNFQLFFPVKYVVKQLENTRIEGAEAPYILEVYVARFARSTANLLFTDLKVFARAYRLKGFQSCSCQICGKAFVEIFNISF